MAVVFDWQTSEDPRDLVHQAVQTLVEGKLVVFPTDTEYGAVALASNHQGIERLRTLWNGAGNDAEFVLTIAKPADLTRFVPQPGQAGRRLAERCWPGPVTLLFWPADCGPAYHELPEATRKLVQTNSGVPFRVPFHPAILETLRLSRGPLVLASSPKATDLAAWQNGALGSAVEMIFDAGPPKFNKPPTVVAIHGAGFAVARAGLVHAQRLQRLASEVVLFVCTGNTCRSPMAEALLKRMLADEIGCAPDELTAHGYTIISAGVAAGGGARASNEARQVVTAYNASLDDHASQGLTPQLVLAADRIVVMTREHEEIVTQLWPHVAHKTMRLCGDEDVADPFGGTPEDYRACAEQIFAALKPLAADLRAARSVTAAQP